MNVPQPITIVGGGLAGLTLGIALRQHQVPVTIWEASSYPRHKVCGEFISGRGQQTLVRLGLHDQFLEAGARWARDTAFFADHVAPMFNPLPQPALCLSRYVLDQVLANEFRRLGGELREKQRWSSGFDQPGLVRASGHRVQAEVGGWRWIGLKVYARRVELEADLELHIVDNGYVGICRLAEKVNVCGLFRSRQPLPKLRDHWRDFLAGSERSALHNRFAKAEFEEESFRAVSGLCLEPRRECHDQECSLGDALTMIPPFTGNGMSMAIESAELAADPLIQYSRGESAWDESRNQITAACDRRFSARLTVANQLNAMFFRPAPRALVFRLGRALPLLWRLMFTHTR